VPPRQDIGLAGQSAKCNDWCDFTGEASGTSLASLRSGNGVWFPEETPMRPATFVALGLALTLTGLAARASAQDGYDQGRLRYAEPGVTLQRATDAGAEEAVGNEPFLPGDRVWTDASGRAEFQFPDGAFVRLDWRSKLDYAGHDEGRDERIVLRLWSGAVLVHSGRGSARIDVETPAGMVSSAERSVVRVDVDGGEVRVTVQDGEATIDDGQRRARLRAGERTFARYGSGIQEPQRFDAREWDEFASWDEQRQLDVRIAENDARYLPPELQPYSGELDRNGDWRYEATAGAYVWVPQVDVGWQPYSNGRWSWTPYGWTWIPSERWGWAPFHYGRWDYAASFGWYWIPGRSWGPAWVSWAVGGGYVGWCPLGRYDRPVVGWGDHRGRHDRLDRGRAVARGGSPYGRGPWDAWNVVRNSELGHRNISRVRLPADRFDPSQFRVADSPSLRPSRDGAALRPASAAPRMVSTRQTPGDFVRELGVDNRTTIPAPWTRGYGPPPAGVEGARNSVPRDRDPGQRESTGATVAPGSSEPAANGRSANAGSARSGRSVPWFRPAEGAPTNGESRSPSGEGGSTSRQANGGRSGWSRPTGGEVRSSGGGSHASGGSGSSGGTSVGSRPSSGGSSRPSGGGSHASGSGGSRSSGGQSRSSGGGGHAAPRSPHRD
jgi:hypothetical protein